MLDDIVAHLCMSFGWTWDYVEARLDEPWLASLNRYLRRCPPMHLLVAGYLGYEPEDDPTTKDDDTRRAEFVQAFMGLGGSVH